LPTVSFAVAAPTFAHVTFYAVIYRTVTVRTLPAVRYTALPVLPPAYSGGGRPTQLHALRLRYATVPADLVTFVYWLRYVLVITFPLLPLTLHRTYYRHAACGCVGCHWLLFTLLFRLFQLPDYGYRFTFGLPLSCLRTHRLPRLVHYGYVALDAHVTDSRCLLVTFTYHRVYGYVALPTT